MASNINPLNPEAGAATTASVRANFQTAKSEIETLQGGLAQEIIDRNAAILVETNARIAAQVPFHVVFFAIQTGATFTNMPAALTAFPITPQLHQNVELSKYTQFRFRMGKGLVAGAAASRMHLYRSDTFNGAVGSALKLNNADLGLPCVTPSTVIDSGWVTIDVARRVDGWVFPAGVGGDGTLDPTFHGFQAWFR